jgi:hypothetical protein
VTSAAAAESGLRPRHRIKGRGRGGEGEGERERERGERDTAYTVDDTTG